MPIGAELLLAWFLCQWRITLNRCGDDAEPLEPIGRATLVLEKQYKRAWGEREKEWTKTLRNLKYHFKLSRPHNLT